MLLYISVLLLQYSMSIFSITLTTLPHIPPHTHTHTHTHTPTHPHPYAHPHTHTPTPTPMHTHTHTHTHTHQTTRFCCYGWPRLHFNYQHANHSESRHANHSDHSWFEWWSHILFENNKIFQGILTIINGERVSLNLGTADAAIIEDEGMCIHVHTMYVKDNYNYVQTIIMLV